MKPSFPHTEASDASYRLLFESNPHPMWVYDRETLAFLAVNDAAIEHYGYSREEFLGITIKDIRPATDVPLLMQILARGPSGLKQVARHLKRDGTTIDVEVTSKPLAFAGRSARLVLANDITERQRAEQLAQATSDLLALAAQKPTPHEFLQSVVEWLRDHTRCQCVGIRVLDEQGHIPYEAFVGFSREFWEQENWIMAGRDHCLCTRVMAETPSAMEMPAMTPAGAFRTSRLSELARSLPTTNTTLYRGACLRSGFESMAILPLRHEGQIVGAVHLADRTPDLMTAPVVALVESLAPLIGSSLRRLQLASALRESEERYRRLFEVESDAILVINHQTERFIDANPAALALYGYSRDELLQRKYYEISAEPDRSRLSFARREKRVVLRWHRKKDGAIFPVEIALSYSDIGGCPMYVAAIRNITERRRIEEELQQSAERLRLAAEASGFGTYDYEFATATWHWSPELRRLWGIPLDQPVHFDAPKLLAQVHPDDRESFRAAMSIATDPRGDGRFRQDFRVIHPDGTAHWLHVRGQTIFAREGQVRHRSRAMGVVLDITERKRTEEALRQSEALLAAAQRIAHIGSWEWNITADTVRWSEEMFRIFNLNPHQPAKHRHEALELIHEEDRPRLDQAVTDALTGTRGFDIRYRRMAPGGEIRFLHAQGEVTRHPDGTPATMVGMLHDITEAVRAEAALREAQAQERRHLRFSESLLAAMPIPVFYKDNTGRYRGCNPAFTETTGLTLEDICGKRAHDLWPAPIAEVYVQKDEEIARYPGLTQMYECTTIFKDGRRRKGLVAKRAFLDEQGRVDGLVGAFMDITERLQTEDELRRSRQRLQALSRRLVELDETARHNLSRELHDRVGQNLTSLSINLSLMQGRLTAKAAQRVGPRLEDSMRLVTETMDRVRDVMADLRPAVLDDYGLAAALRWSGARFAERTGLPVEVTGPDSIPRLPAPAEIALFRIAQEALTNVARHARARQVRITLGADESSVRLEIADNGMGFDPAAAGKRDGQATWGLTTMRERAESVGARCRVEAAPGSGTKIVVELDRPPQT